MNQKLRILKNLLAEILNYLLFWAIGMVILTDFVHLRVNQLWLWVLGLLAVFYYTLRERCKRFLVFLSLHILPIAAFGMHYRGNIFQKIWMLAVMVILAMISFSKKMHSTEMGMEVILPVIFGGLLCVLYLIDKKQGSGACAGLLLYTLIGFVMGYLAHYFLGQFLHYMEINNRMTENIPAGRVLRSSAGLAGGFTVLAGVLMVLGADRDLLDRIGAAIHQAIIRLLRFLLSFLPRGAEAEEEMEAVLPQETSAFMPLEEMEITEPSIFMKILEILFGVLAMAAIAVLLFIAVVRLLRWIRDVFSRKKASVGNLDEVHEDLVEKLEKHEGKEREKKITIWERAQKVLSPEERIRRIYKKTIEKKLLSMGDQRKNGLSCAKTPREWCAGLFPGQEQQALEFAVLYEKARYSSRLCSTDDVRRARKLAEEFHR